MEPSDLLTAETSTQLGKALGAIDSAKAELVQLVEARQDSDAIVKAANRYMEAREEMSVVMQAVTPRPDEGDAR